MESVSFNVAVFGDNEPVLPRVKKAILKRCLRGLTETGDKQKFLSLYTEELVKNPFTCTRPSLIKLTLLLDSLTTPIDNDSDIMITIVTRSIVV